MPRPRPRFGGLGPGKLIGGRSYALDARLNRSADLLDSDVSTLSGDTDANHWRARHELYWAPPDASLLKIPLTRAKAGVLEQVLAALDTAHAARIYSAGIQRALDPAGRFAVGTAPGTHTAWPLTP